MNDSIVMPAARIDSAGNIRSMDSPYEQGAYIAVIGRYRSDNPYPRNDKLNRLIWLRGYNETSAKSVTP